MALILARGPLPFWSATGPPGPRDFLHGPHLPRCARHRFARALWTV